jgi:hypothetical protein
MTRTFAFYTFQLATKENSSVCSLGKQCVITQMREDFISYNHNLSRDKFI